MIINIFGVPSSAGALYRGTEKSPEIIRRLGIVNKLEKQGFKVVDHGDIENFNDLPRHNIGPVRNWPSPRVVWEKILSKSEEIFKDGEFSILLGGDCSMEVGSFSAFRRVYGDKAHLIVLDGHVDIIKPQGETCIGAAGMGLWFLTDKERAWWGEEAVKASDISVLGVQSVPKDCMGIGIIPLSELKADRELKCVKDYLDNLSEDTKIFVHLDVDILNEVAMPSAYAPGKDGLDIEEGRELIRIILGDKRIMGIEVTEFSGDKESSEACAEIIVDLISELKIRLDVDK